MNDGYVRKEPFCVGKDLSNRVKCMSTNDAFMLFYHIDSVTDLAQKGQQGRDKGPGDTIFTGSTGLSEKSIVVSSEIEAPQAPPEPKEDGAEQSATLRDRLNLTKCAAPQLEPEDPWANLRMRFSKK